MNLPAKIRLGLAVLLVLLASAASALARPVNSVRTVLDEAGRTVNLPDNVNRIVTLAPNLTEIVFALGAENRLVGVSDYCDYPPAALQKPKVGSPLDPSLEAIAALKPDLVLATQSINREVTVDSLSHLGIPVYTTNPQSVAGVLRSIEHIADAIGSTQQGQVIVSGLEARLATLQARLAGVPVKSVLFVVWLDPLISIGPHTFLADAIRLAGGKSIIQTKQNWPQVSLEEVVRLHPDAIVLAANHAESGNDDVVNLQQEPVWRDLKAVREGHIAVVGEEIDRPCPRLVDAIESLARQLHPEALAPPATENPLASRTVPPNSPHGNACNGETPCSR